MEKILKTLVNKGNYLFVKTEEHSSVYVNTNDIVGYVSAFVTVLDDGKYYAEIAEGPKGPYAKCVGQYKAMLRRGYGNPQESADLIAKEKAKAEAEAKKRAEARAAAEAAWAAKRAAEKQNFIKDILEKNYLYVTFEIDMESQGENFIATSLRIDGKKISEEELHKINKGELPTYWVEIPCWQYGNDKDLPKNKEYRKICDILKNKTYNEEDYKDYE